MANSLNPALVDVIIDMFICPTAALQRSTTPDDIDGWDSLSHAVLLMKIERALGIRLDRFQTVALENIGDLSDMVDRLQAVQASEDRHKDQRGSD